MGRAGLAAAEAATRGCPLAIINACSPPVAPGPFALVFGLDGGDDDVSTVLRRQGEERVRLIAPDIKVTSRTVVGGAAPALTSQPAQLLVVGTRGLGRVRSALAGSPSTRSRAR